MIQFLSQFNQLPKAIGQLPANCVKSSSQNIATSNPESHVYGIIRPRFRQAIANKFQRQRKEPCGA